MTALYKRGNELQRQWRQQFTAHCNPRTVAARKGFVAMTFVDYANGSSSFVDVDNLLIILVYEDDSGRYYHSPLRFAGYRVSRIDGGVCWGGAENCRLFKDLTLAPQRGAYGQRMDRNKPELLSLALQLDRRLSRAGHHPAAPWPQLRLPVLWAGFRSRHAAELRGEGPEFERACRDRKTPPSDLFHQSAREIEGLVAVPMDWVDCQLGSVVAVFAEITLSLRRQVCRIGDLPDGLMGFCGASRFDFFNSQFRAAGRYRRRRPVSDRKRAICPMIPAELALNGELTTRGSVA